MNREINRLLNFGLQQGLIKEEDYCYAANRLLAVLKIDEFEPEQVEEIYTLPDRNRVDGVVYASKPLNYNGNLIEGICLELKEGKVTIPFHKKPKDLSTKTLKSIFKQAGL